MLTRLDKDALRAMLDSLYLIEEFVGNTRCLVLSKTPQVADQIDELTETWNSGQK